MNPNRARADRKAEGRAARRRVTRSDLGPWNRQTRRQDARATLAAQNEWRVAELLPIRAGRMAASPWTYFRGAAAVMAADLAATPHTGALVQMCGDAHVLNFGLWATPERNLSFDLRDFDETLPGPFEWDVKRLATSLVVLARENDRTDAEADAAVARALAAYRTRMRRYSSAPELDVWYSGISADRLVEYFEPEDRERVSARIERQARRRTSRGAAERLTTTRDGRARITENRPFRVPLDDPAEIELETRVLETYRATLRPDRGHLLDRFSVADVARQVVGVGSVGMRVYLVLLEGRGGDDPLFLQIKQAAPSVYEPHLGPSPYANNGERVVHGKHLIQTASDIFVGWTSVAGFDFYVRQFRDMKIVPDSDRIAPRLGEFAEACGGVLARAHARTGDALVISSYIGKSPRFDEAIGAFARSYADQNECDHTDFAAAVSSGAIESAPGW
jgi:uncharacterized protein (DUF2252 family)